MMTIFIYWLWVLIYPALSQNLHKKFDCLFLGRVGQSERWAGDGGNARIRERGEEPSDRTIRAGSVEASFRLDFCLLSSWKSKIEEKTNSAPLP